MIGEEINGEELGENAGGRRRGGGEGDGSHHLLY